jgi:hypothetical protein
MCSERNMGFNTIIIIFIQILFHFSFLYSDIIVLNDGTKGSGKIVKITDDYVEFIKDGNKQEVKIDCSVICYIINGEIKKVYNNCDTLSVIGKDLSIPESPKIYDQHFLINYDCNKEPKNGKRNIRTGIILNSTGFSLGLIGYALSYWIFNETKDDVDRSPFLDFIPFIIFGTAGGSLAIVGLSITTIGIVQKLKHREWKIICNGLSLNLTYKF